MSSSNEPTQKPVDTGAAKAISLDFASLGLGPASLDAISKKGFEQATRIQAEVIPLLLEGSHDVIAQSHTGTGKTAAFGLPLLEMLKPGQGYVQALILVPTRELAVQVAEELNSLKGSRRFHIIPVYGGQGYELQFRHLRQGVDILVGTPGRLIDHLQRGSLDLSRLTHLVLDEADEMLDMGFIDDIEAILGTCSAEKRMLLFSATMPPRIRQIADTWMKDIQQVVVKGSALTTSLTTQQYIEVRDEDRFEALCRIIDHAHEFYGMIFCRTKVESDRVYTRLLERGYTAEVLHGDVSQTMREKVLESFRRRLSEIMVATDVAARGIDVGGLTHVINYELPQDPESYVHRIGRTGRAGKEGIAITFISPREFRKLQFIQKQARGEIRRQKLPRIEDIMDQKRSRLIKELTDLLLEAPVKEHEDFENLAKDLLAMELSGKTLEAKDIVTALLRHQLSTWLDSSRYAEIFEYEPRQDQRGGRGGYESRGPSRGYREGGNREGGYRSGPPREGGYRDSGYRGSHDNKWQSGGPDFHKTGKPGAPFHGKKKGAPNSGRPAYEGPKGPADKEGHFKGPRPERKLHN